MIGRRVTRFLYVCLTLAGLSAAALAGLPGPQHGVWPLRRDLVEISPGLWTDAPERATELQGMVDMATARIAPFYGDVPPGRLILCTQQPCADRLGLAPAGLTWGAALAAVSPDGLTPDVIGHELSHLALHRQMGWWHMARGTLPYWVDEGLAVYLSPDPRYIRPDTVAEAEWITDVQRLRDWKRLVTADNWPQVYGAAGRMIEGIAADIGDDGLRALIDAVLDGTDFDRELARLRAAALDP